MGRQCKMDLKEMYQYAENDGGSSGLIYMESPSLWDSEISISYRVK